MRLTAEHNFTNGALFPPNRRHKINHFGEKNFFVDEPREKLPPLLANLELLVLVDVNRAAERLERTIEKLLVDLSKLRRSVHHFNQAQVHKSNFYLTRVIAFLINYHSPMPVVLVHGADSLIRVNATRWLADSRRQTKQLEYLEELALVLFRVEHLEPELAALVYDVVDPASELAVSEEPLRVDVDQVIELERLLRALALVVVEVARVDQIRTRAVVSELTRVRCMSMKLFSAFVALRLDLLARVLGLV